MKRKPNTTLVSLTAWTVVCCLALMLGSCSRTKDKAIPRFYHRTTAKYNILFNGTEAIGEAVFTNESGHKDDFSAFIPPYPGRGKTEMESAEQAAKRAVEKATKAIKEHSMMIGGSQKNTAIFDAYMVMGRAFSASGQPFKAMEAFGQILRNAPKSKQAHFAKWEVARLYAEQGNVFASNNLLEELDRHRETPKKLLPHIRAVYAMLRMAEGNFSEAHDEIRVASTLLPRNALRARWHFLEGQLAEKLGEGARAGEAYAHCARANPTQYEMTVEAGIRSAMLSAASKTPGKRYDALEKMAKEPKNNTYRGQIFYAMAQVALTAEDRPKAFHSFGRSIQASAIQPEQKGLSFAGRGQMYFEDAEYPAAQSDIDSAALLLPEGHAQKSALEKRRRALNHLVEELHLISLQDSLLQLSPKSDAELREFFQEYIADLKEKESKEAKAKQRAEEIATLQAERNSLLANAGPQAGQFVGAWLFYNPSVRTAGMASFQKRMGSRLDVDNWKWSALTTGQSEANTEDPTQNGAARDAVVSPTGLEKYNAESYLALVPRTEAARDSARAIIRRAKVRLGAVYRDEILDQALATETYEQWLKDYQSLKYPEEPLVHYALMRLYVADEKPMRAEEYRKNVLTRFPKSKFAALLRGEIPTDNGKENPAHEFYAKALESFQNNKTTEAMEWLAKVHGLNSKKALLTALIIGKTQGVKPYTEALRSVAKEYTNTPEGAAAQNFLLALGEEITTQGM